MDLVLGLSGWAIAGWAGLCGFAVRRSRGERAEAAARALHELRGPLTAARLGIELGLRSGGVSRERLQALDLELQRATLALEDLSGQSALQTGHHLWGEVEVGQLIADSAQASAALAARRGGAVDTHWSGAAAWVRGNRVRLAQALGNLIANAVEHGGGQVAVKGHRLGSVVRVEVTDGGPGLPCPVTDLAHRPRWGRGARGRGLAIALAIAEDHGGRLAAAPSERGARLVLELPAAEAGQEFVRPGGEG